MKVTLINHSSLLFKLSDKIFLTDFWNLSPAFGSWLPSALPFYNITYLASLSYNKSFFLVISHAHDDHIDDYYLKNYFNKDMNIIINEFPSSSLKRRINKMGFENVITLPKDITKFNGFEAISIFYETMSNDDAGIAFRDKNYCIHHGNDNWFKLREDNLKKLKDFSKNRKFLYCAQTNTASGYPMTYPQHKNNLSIELKNKVKKMVITGLENVKNLNADYFLPYAGYSKSYVKGKNYHNEAFNPTYENLLDLIKDEKIDNKNKIINIFCGGTFDLNNESVTYPFDYDPEVIFKVTDKFVRNENILDKCDTFNPDFNEKINSVDEIKSYLIKFNDFVLNYLKRFPNFYPTILNKKLCFEVIDKNKNFSVSFLIGEGSFLDSNENVNKKFVIPSNLFKALIDKKIVFDNLYTGYEAQVFRYPIEQYNRDIIMYLNMFGYKYKNS